MRCQCCNANLSDYESVLKHPVTMEYLDVCVKCLKDIPIQPIKPADKVDTTSYDEASLESDDYSFWFNDEEENENSV